MSGSNDQFMNVWGATLFYVQGQLVQPSTPNGHFYKAMSTGFSNGVEPTWPTDGSTVVDNLVTWLDLGTSDPTAAVTTWAPETAYDEASIVEPPTPDGHVYITYPGFVGTSGTWPNGNGAPNPWVPDGLIYEGSLGQEASTAGANFPGGGIDPTDGAYSGQDGEVYWQDIGPFGEAPTEEITQRGLCVAFDDAMLEPDPTWTSLYDYETVDGKRALRIQGVHIERGRQSELEKTGVATATVTAKDFLGILDPTNADGPFYGKIDVLKQAAFFLTNPTTGDEKTMFRGLIANIESELDVSKRFMTHTIDLVGFMEQMATAGVPVDSSGTASYAATDVQTRLLAAAADAGLPDELVEFFTGNVNVQAKKYAPGDETLSVAYDAADAEFPGLANLYDSKEGIVTFHGREARFHPENATYHISHWYAGDDEAVDADTFSRVVPINALRWRRSKDDVYNSVTAFPESIKDEDMSGQTVEDSTSIDDRGKRTLSFENLQTGDGNPDGNDANAETLLFATYYKNNYATPRTRVESLGFGTRRAGSKNFDAWWAFVCGVDISDLISLSTSHPGGGGFLEDYFVERVEYDLTPRKAEFPKIDLEVGLSPRSWLDSNPFPEADS